MPFGLIFGAMFFFLCAWLGLKFIGGSDTPVRVAGLLLMVLGLALACGLLMRRNWARWGGALCASGLVLFGAFMIHRNGSAMDFLLLLSALATVALLLLPATGGGRRDPGAAVSGEGGFSRLLEASATISALGLLAVAFWAYRADPPRRTEPVLPAVLTERVQWSDFADGLQRARAEDKPLLVNFIATWCGYCTKMDNTTFKHPSVIERMDDFVPVRLDIDDTRSIGGFAGADLAREYQVDGTPTTLLLDLDGRVLARAGGYQSTRQFLLWLDDALNRAPAGGNLAVSGR